MEQRDPNAVNNALDFPLSDEFEATLNELFANEPSEKVVISLLDVDTFLSINKAYGHNYGDDVLITLGRTLENNIPDCAKVFRIAGDEFGIIFKGELEKEDVFLIMNTIREKFEKDNNFKTPDGKSVTISVGIAEAFDDATRTVELMRKAESAMFRAKTAGRNKVMLAREEKMVTKTSHYTLDQLERLTKLSKREGIGEAILLREALDMLLKKYDI